MSKVTELKPAAKTVNEHAVELLEELLQQVKSGEVIGVSIIAENRGGTWATIRSSTASTAKRVGHTFALMMDDLGYGPK